MNDIDTKGNHSMRKRYVPKGQIRATIALCPLLWLLAACGNSTDERFIAAKKEALGRVPQQTKYLQVWDSSVTVDELSFALAPLQLLALEIPNCRKIDDSFAMSLENQKCLERVDLSGTSIGPSVLGALRGCPRLIRANLSSIGVLDHRCFAALSGLKNLKALVLAGNKFKAADIIQLGNNQELESLDFAFWSGYDSSSVVTLIQSLPKLRDLDLTGTDVTQQDAELMLKSSSVRYLSLARAQNISKAALTRLRKLFPRHRIDDGEK